MAFAFLPDKWAWLSVLQKSNQFNIHFIYRGNVYGKLKSNVEKRQIDTNMLFFTPRALRS